MCGQTLTLSLSLSLSMHWQPPEGLDSHQTAIDTHTTILQSQDITVGYFHKAQGTL